MAYEEEREEVEEKVSHKGSLKAPAEELRCRGKARGSYWKLEVKSEIINTEIVFFAS